MGCIYFIDMGIYWGSDGCIPVFMEDPRLEASSLLDCTFKSACHFGGLKGLSNSV